MKNYFTSLLLLSTLFYLPRGDSQYKQESPIYAEAYMCYPFNGADTDALNIGQNWGTAEPTATTQIDLLKVTRSSCSSEEIFQWPPGLWGPRFKESSWFTFRGTPESGDYLLSMSRSLEDVLEDIEIEDSGASASSSTRPDTC